jgi:hypothetical protein
MHFKIRRTVIAVATAAACVTAGAARAGDDGAAPLWEGIGSIFGPLVGLSKDEKDPIDYREHGKIVVPKSLDLPPPGAATATVGGPWPVNQEVQRKALLKQQEKDKIAGVGNARLRYTHPFPNAPVTVGPADPSDASADQSGGDKAQSTSMLGNLNPLGWVGIGKTTKLGPEPDREWLTDPPKGYRAPVAQTATGGQKPASTGQASTGQASN